MTVRSVALGIFLLAGWAARIDAQEVSVRAYVDRSEVGLNQAFVLSVEIEGAPGGGLNPQIPDLSGFSRFLGSSSSQSMQIVNGSMSTSFTTSYRFQATTVGTFTIPSIRVRVAGDDYDTDPITLTIADSPQSTTPGKNAAPDDGGDGIAPEDVFLEAVPDRRRVYPGQPVVVEYRIYTRLNITSYSVSQLPTASGFWVEEFDIPQPRTETVVRDGVQYATAMIRKVALFPTGSGTRTLDPMSVDAQVRIRRRPGRDPFDNFFSGGSLFGREESVLVSSDPITIEVTPLPTTGRPADFSGFVGSLTVAASVDRTEVATNEALTYTVTVSGNGNTRTLSDLDVAFPADFEVFPPEITDRTDNTGDRIGGRRSYSWVLVPRTPGEVEIPAVSINYFDPRTETYEVATAAPIAVTVTGDPIGAPVISGRGRSAIQPLREDIRFIQIADPRLHRTDRTMFDSPIFWAVLLIPLATLGGAAGVRRHRDRLAGDVAWARRRRADRMAKKRLHAARGKLSENSRREFYAEIGKALRGFIGDKLNLAEASFMADEVRRLLLERGAGSSVVEEYLACIEVCDRQRFAPVAATETEMRELLERAEHSMAALHEEL